MIRRNSQTGFTLVELMLSMAFVSVLLLSIAMLVLQISGIYNKGLTMRAVNEAGQLITSDIQRTLNTSLQQETVFLQKPDVNPTGGRLCAGTTVYAWNYGQYLGKPTAWNKDTDGGRDIVLVTFEDEGKDYCVPTDDGSYYDIPTDATKLLAKDGTNLAIHTFGVNDGSDGKLGEPVEGDPTQRMYALSLTIGTNDDNDDGSIVANGCTIPKSVVDDQYCGVNTFNFVARAGSEG